MPPIPTDFRLRNTQINHGQEKSPRPVRLSPGPGGWRIDRRGFLGLAGGLGLTAMLRPGSALADLVLRASDGDEIYAHGRSVSTAALTPDHLYAVTYDVNAYNDQEQAFKFWDLGKRAHLASLPARMQAENWGDFAMTLGRNPLGDGYLMAYSLDHSGDVHLVSMPDGADLGGINLGPGEMDRLALSPDGARLLALSGGRVKLWDTVSQSLAGDTGSSGQSTDAKCLAVNPQGGLFATGHGLEDQGLVKIWTLGQGNLLAEIPTSTSGDKAWQHNVPLAAFSPNGELLTVFSDRLNQNLSWTRQIRTWRVATGELVGAIDVGNAFQPGRLGFMPDNNTIYAGLSQVKIFSFSGEQVGSFPEDMAVRDFVDENVVIATDGRKLFLWDRARQAAIAYFMDVKSCQPREAQGRVYELDGDPQAHTIYCGYPLPEGATCTCDCVQGEYDPSYGGGGDGGGVVCVCDLVWY